MKYLKHIFISFGLLVVMGFFFTFSLYKAYPDFRIDGGKVDNFFRLVVTNLTATNANITNLTAGTVTTSGNAASDFHKGITVGQNGIANAAEGSVIFYDGKNPGSSVTNTYTKQSSLNSVNGVPLGNATGVFSSLSTTGTGSVVLSANSTQTGTTNFQTIVVSQNANVAGGKFSFNGGDAITQQSANTIDVQNATGGSLVRFGLSAAAPTLSSTTGALAFNGTYRTAAGVGVTNSTCTNANVSNGIIIGCN